MQDGLSIGWVAIGLMVTLGENLTRRFSVKNWMAGIAQNIRYQMKQEGIWKVNTF